MSNEITIKKQSVVDQFVYVLSCIGSFGLIYLARLVITKAIVMALESQKIEISIDKRI